MSGENRIQAEVIPFEGKQEMIGCQKATARFCDRQVIFILSGLMLILLLPPVFSAGADPAEPIVARRPDVSETTGTGLSLSAEALAEQAKSSVVTVSFAGRDGQQAGLGTGFVISADGLIATNLHAPSPCSLWTARNMMSKRCTQPTDRWIWLCSRLMRKI